MVPELFGRIDFWRVGWKPLDVEPPTQNGLPLPHGRAVRIPTIQHQENATMTSRLITDEAHDLFGTEVALLQVPVHLNAAACRREFHGSNDAEPIVPIPTTQRGSTPPRCPTPAAGRLEHEAAFV
jgi:hypothetical protein